MAAVSLIVGSVVGWIVAAIALLSGALASTALIIFVLASLSVASVTLIFANARAHANKCPDSQH